MICASTGRLRVGVVLLLSGSACGAGLAAVDTELGQTTTAPLVLAAGTSVVFPVSATWVSFDQAKWMLLRVELLKGGSVVGTVDCKGYSFSRSGSTTSGCGSGGTQTFEDCHAVIPQDGVDSVRVSTKTDAGTASMRGLRVLVRAK